MLVNLGQKQLEREQRRLFDKMTNFENIDEVYLLVVSGMACINKVTFIEKLVSNLQKFKRPENLSEIDN